MKKNTTNVIEINGKLYDARTGKSVDGSGSTKKISGASIDGISHGKSQKTNPQTQKKEMPPQKKVEETPEAKQPTRKEHAKAPHLKHRAQRSKTLHRGALKAPKLQPEKGATPASVKTREAGDSRLERALKISKSAALSRFPISDFRKPEAEKPASKEASNIVMEKTPIIPAKKPVATEATPKPKKVSAKQRRSPKRFKKHFTLTGYIITGITILVLAGYIAYLNVPSLSMQVASKRAGFDASLPSYTPTSYKIDGPVSYSPGIVTINFKSGSENKSFSLMQQPSNWDSLALKESYISSETDQPAVTQQYNGLTLYLFEGKVAWVNAGKLFEIDTEGSQLGLEEIQKLATSL